MDNWPLIINFLLYTAFFLFQFKKKQKARISVFIIGMYCITNLSSIFLFSHDYSSFLNSDIKLYPFLYYFFLISISLYPLCKSDDISSSVILPPHPVLYRQISLIIGVIGTVSFFSLIPDLYVTIKNGLSDAVFFKLMYSNAAEREAMRGAVDRDVNYIAVLSNISSASALFFLFYNLCTKELDSKINLLLLFASLSYVVSAITSANRGTIIILFFNMIILYLLFYNHISVASKRVLRTMILSVLGLLLPIFIFITASRFSDRVDIGEKAVDYSVLNYLGQSPLYFNKYVDKISVLQEGDNCLPLFRGIIGLDYSKNIYERQFTWRNIGNEQGMFYGFIGDLVFDFGMELTALILVVVSLLLRFSFANRTGFIYFHQLYLMYFWANICATGIFYFYYKTIGGNLIIIFSLLIFFIFRLKQKNRSALSNLL